VNAFVAINAKFMHVEKPAGQLTYKNYRPNCHTVLVSASAYM